MTPLAEHQQGELVGGVETALQADGEEEQGDADQAAEEVRDLDQWQRDEAGEPAQAGVHRRRRAREEEHGAADEGGERQHLRHDVGRPLAEDAGDLAQARLRA